MDKNSLAYFAYGNGPSLVERQRQQARGECQDAAFEQALALLRAARGEAMTHELHDRIVAFLEALDA